jgi:hypothetical protein
MGQGSYGSDGSGAGHGGSGASSGVEVVAQRGRSWSWRRVSRFVGVEAAARSAHVSGGVCRSWEGGEAW